MDENVGVGAVEDVYTLFGLGVVDLKLLLIVLVLENM
jgi:hypothetical protein